MSISSLVADIIALPQDWHGAGSLPPDVLGAIARHCSGLTIRNSVETGAGKSTLLLSHLSAHHVVFALDDGLSLTRVRESPLLCRSSVHFVEGPSQVTVPAYAFTPLQVALIDGPHEYPCPDLEWFYIARHLDTGGILIVDDIDIPTIHNLFDFLKADRMFELVEVVGATAFFRRTAIPTLDPDGDCRDRWWLQGYNKRKKLVGYSPVAVLKWMLPAGAKRALKRFLHR